MIRGIGCDLADIARVARALENPRFLDRVYTPAEQDTLRGLCDKRRSERAAGLFAAKEAAAKALGTGFRGFGFADVEILPDAMGHPTVTLRGGAKALTLPSDRMHMTISHDGGMALAFAVWESRDREEDCP